MCGLLESIRRRGAGSRKSLNSIYGIRDLGTELSPITMLGHDGIYSERDCGEWKKRQGNMALYGLPTEEHDQGKEY